MSTPPELFTAEVKKVRNAENEAAFMQQAAHRSERTFRYISHSLFMLVCITVLHQLLFFLILYKLKQNHSLSQIKFPWKKVFWIYVSFFYYPFHKIVGRNNKTDRSQIYQNFLCNNQLIIKSRWKPPALDPTYIYMYACILIYTYKPLISEFKFIFHDKMKTSMSTRMNTSCLM